MLDLSIVIPTYNERDNIAEIVRRIEAALSSEKNRLQTEIVFVDDSTDDTPEVIRKIAETHPGVRVKHRDSEKGLATAVLQGFEMAEGKFIAVMDADLQHPPEVLRGMYAAMVSENADLCIPSRLIPDGYDGGLNWYRKLVSGTARIIGKMLLPCLRPVSDPTGGLFMLRREIIEKADLRPVGWKIMIEVLATASYRTIVEIPYEFHNRAAGESKLDGKVTLQYLQQCFSLRKRSVHNDVKVQRWRQSQTTAAISHIFG